MKKRLLFVLLFSLCIVGCGKKDQLEDAKKTYYEKKNKYDFVELAYDYYSKVLKYANEEKDYKLKSTDTLYMIPVGHDKGKSCVFLDRETKSPYSDTWTYAYIGVTYDGRWYSYYFIGEDGSGNGIPFIDIATLNNDGVDYLYNKPRAKQPGNRILNELYNKQGSNATFRVTDASSNFGELSSIINVDYKYDKIVIIGSKNCSYK